MSPKTERSASDVLGERGRADEKFGFDREPAFGSWLNKKKKADLELVRIRAGAKEGDVVRFPFPSSGKKRERENAMVVSSFQSGGQNVTQGGGGRCL